jgi:ribonuclease VapC
MLVDTSVIMAIHNKEEGFESLLRAVTGAKRRWLSVISYLEFVMVTKNLGWIDGLINAAGLELVPVSKRDIDEAVNGFFRYGKGVNPAGLNFGDCIVYGTAKAAGASVLFKGDDFSQTDVLQCSLSGDEG